MDRLLRQYCTFGFHAPPHKLSKTGPRFDKPLYEHMKIIHEVWDADAEPCLQLAGLECANHGGIRGNAPLPNNKLVVKDVTRAARRVLQRPQDKDEMMKEIVDTIVVGRRSIIQRIRHSPALQAIFAGCVGEMGDCNIADSLKELKNMSSALHRFNSVLEPCSKAVLLWPALIGAAFKIMIGRRGKEEGDDGRAFLEYISGEDGLHRCVRLAMFTDMLSISSGFLRFFDNETWDAAKVRQQIHKYAYLLHWAFVRGDIVHATHSFTYVMLAHLKKATTVQVNKSLRTIGKHGGVPPEIISQCLKEHCTMAVVSIAVLRAEFPEWSLLQSFALFDIAAHVDMSRAGDLQRIAHTFKIDYPALHAQFLRALPRAQELKRVHPGMPDEDAWKSTCKAMGSPQALRDALMRYICLSGCTTSGVEHIHAWHDWLWPQRRRRLSDDRENDEIQILNGKNNAERESMIQVAQEIWRKLYGKPRRTSAKPKQCKSRANKTLTNWMRVHRESLNAASSRMPAHTDLRHLQSFAAERACNILTKPLEDELDRQSLMRTKTRLHSLTEGTLLPHEIKAEWNDAAQHYINHMAALRRTRLRQAAQKDDITRPKSRDGKRLPIQALVYLEPNCLGADQSIYAQNLIIQKAMVATQDHAKALIFVTGSFAEALATTIWAVTLNGGAICDTTFFCSDGEHGSSIVYKSAITRGGTRSKPRMLWISDKFQNMNPDITTVIRNSVAKPCSVWSCINKEQLVDAVGKDEARPQKQRRPLQAIGLAADNEKPILQELKYMFTGDALLAQFVLHDPVESVLGIGSL